jgi:hypothetical protein
VLGNQGGASNPSAGYLNKNAATVGKAVATRSGDATAGKFAASGQKVFDDQLGDLGRK